MKFLKNAIDIKALATLVVLLTQLILLLPLSAQELEIIPLGEDEWLTGPESETNAGYTMQHPNGFLKCSTKVPLWVMDIGTAIPDTNGKLSMIVGGDTFYRPQNAADSCYYARNNRNFLCDRIELPPFFDAYYPSDCKVDADCTGHDNMPLDFVNWKCDAEFGFCAMPDLHLFCNTIYSRMFTPDVVTYCYITRGSHNYPQAELKSFDQGVCQWLAGDHFCLTQLYDDTCDQQCLLDDRQDGCEDSCSIDCVRSCNAIGQCKHRNQTFHDARIEKDKTGYRVRLIKDRPEYFIPRTRDEWHDVGLFGVYPGDYFYDSEDRLYLLTDTRTWLAKTIDKEILRSGIGIYSFADNMRIPFHGILGSRSPVKIWKKGEDVDSVSVINTNPYILFPRGSGFSEAAVIHGLDKDVYTTSSNEPDKQYIYLLGSGPACSPGQSCVLSAYTSKGSIARAPAANKEFMDYRNWEHFAGLEDGASVWTSKANIEKNQSAFSFFGFKPSSVIKWQGEYLHIESLPDLDTKEYALIHLLRSPDGLNWFDGGTFPVFNLEKPLRTRFVYSAKWLPVGETGEDPGFILSHWLTYEGYFQAESFEKRFRDYNMKSYRIKKPQKRSYLVHSNRYSKSENGRIDLPVSVYQSNADNALQIALQYCLCENAANCKQQCPAWSAFGPKQSDRRNWQNAVSIEGSDKTLSLSKLGENPLLQLKKKKHQKHLKQRNLLLQWHWKKDIQLENATVILRFGLTDSKSKKPYAKMLSSIRTMPEIYQSDTELLHNAGGWKTTEPVNLR